MNQSISLSLTLLIFFIIPYRSDAQELTNYQTLKDFKSSSSTSNEIYFYGRKKETEFRSKSPSIWQKSVLLTTKNDTLITKAFIDLPKDEIQILIGSTPYILYPEKITAILIGEAIYIPSQYPNENQLFSTYFELLQEGPVLLLAKNDGTFYYKKQQSPAQKIKRSKKGLSAVFTNQKERLKGVFKNKKLNPKNDADLSKIFYWMNQSFN